jgi:hypothetical protein
MKDEILDINQIFNNLSENIFIKETNEGLILVDSSSNMTFL